MGQYEYINSTTGKLKVRNVVGSYDEKSGIVRFDCDIKALDSDTGDSDNVDINLYFKSGGWANVDLRYKGSTASPTTSITAPPDKWVSHTFYWDAYKELQQKDWGFHEFKLKVRDEDDNALEFERKIKVNANPVDHNLTITSHDFGNDSTPDITWTLSDLFLEQFMTPVITSGGATTNSLTIYLDDGDGTTTEVTGLTSGIMNMNGVPIKDSSVRWSTGTESDKTYFKRISSYKMTAPAMVEGVNDFTIDLQCENE